MFAGPGSSRMRLRMLCFMIAVKHVNDNSSITVSHIKVSVVIVKLKVAYTIIKHHILKHHIPELRLGSLRNFRRPTSAGFTSRHSCVGCFGSFPLPPPSAPPSSRASDHESELSP